MSFLIKVKRYLQKDFKSYLLILVILINGIYHFLPKSGIVMGFLRSLAPSPIVYSNPLKRKNNKKNFVFEFYRDETTYVEKKMTRSYYSTLPGPHSFKTFHFMALKINHLVKDPNNREFYKDFFCNDKNLARGFQIDFKIYKIVVKNKKKVFYELYCKN